MSTQIIEKNGKAEYAVIPFQEYQELLEKAEMADDVKAFDIAMADDDELIPGPVAKDLVNGNNPVAVWRKYRGLSQAELAEKADVSQAYIGQVETGKRKGSVEFYKAVSAVLNLDIDDLV